MGLLRHQMLACRCNVVTVPCGMKCCDMWHLLVWGLGLRVLEWHIPKEFCLPRLLLPCALSLFLSLSLSLFLLHLHGCNSSNIKGLERDGVGTHVRLTFQAKIPKRSCDCTGTRPALLVEACHCLEFQDPVQCPDESDDNLDDVPFCVCPLPAKSLSRNKPATFWSVVGLGCPLGCLSISPIIL